MTSARAASHGADETWNPLRGCSRVSAGCANCYAEVLAAAGPRLTAAGLNLSEREILTLVAELLTADEPPAPQAPTDRETPTTQPLPVPTAALRPNARVCDADCREAVTARPNLIVPWLLMAGYAYHHLDAPILSDGYPGSPQTGHSN